MTITINGAKKQLPDNSSLKGALEDQNLNPENARGIAVAVNDRVVPRQKWETEELKNGDRMEVITARQGG